MSNLKNKIEKVIDNSESQVYNKFTSESGHWYTQEGEPMYTIIGANGKERNTNLRDAKLLLLVPSVTTVMDLVAKPSLENWKINQALNSALSLNKEDGESNGSFIYRCKQDAKKPGMEAADLGTKIHAQIERGFLGTSTNKAYRAVKKYLDEHFPNEEWIAEDSFCAKQGYGGMIDLYSKSGIFVDFKTKDKLQDKKIKQLIYDSHGMQLSAYAQGCGFVDPERVSIFVDRKDTGFIVGHVWNKESHAKHLAMFNSMLTYWKFSKNYDPTGELI